MAIDNLNYMSSWLPAWQQTDKYSSQPWCLKSKNLDIFSSSKSMKATAFSTPVAWDDGVIAAEWGLVLKTDWKVYEVVDWVETLFIDPAANFPVYKVSYNWKSGTYADAQRWTVQDMSVAVEWDEWKSFVVFTDRASYTYSKVKYVAKKSFNTISSIFTQQSWSPYNYGYVFQKSVPSGSDWTIAINVESFWMSTIPIRVYADQAEASHTNIFLEEVKVRKHKYYYDAEMDGMVTNPEYTEETVPISHPWNLRNPWWMLVNIPAAPTYSSWYLFKLKFSFAPKSWQTDYSWTGNLYIDMNWWPDETWHMRDETNADWDFNYYYSYLSTKERRLQDVWEYYWIKGASFQPLYDWESSWVDVNWEKKTRYDFVQYMWWANDPWMDIVWLISWNEQIFMIWNLNGNGYIIPCDLTGWKWTPYIAYWCTFTGVTNIDYLLYLVWEDRGISTLWVFNQQELVPVIWWNKENQTNDKVNTDEQYNFDWKIVNWRKNLILTTKDNRIFQYGQTYGGKGGSFIHQLPADAVITSLKTVWNDLVINYSITVNDTTTNYSIKYQDDTNLKNYNTEWEAVYPIVLWNHILEKEESDLFCSYILPSASTKLEFWGCANHYHFWTFTSEDNPTLSDTESYKIKGTSWNYALKFIEKNANQYTFRLEWDLPVQTTNEMQITDSEGAVVINYTEYNHFRKIWAIETDKYCEWEFRFHNLNNKLELPKSHSLQIMVKGKWTANYTPELFSVDLVANQRERW